MVGDSRHLHRDPRPLFLRELVGPLEVPSERAWDQTMRRSHTLYGKNNSVWQWLLLKRGSGRRFPNGLDNLHIPWMYNRRSAGVDSNNGKVRQGKPVPGNYHIALEVL